MVGSTGSTGSLMHRSVSWAFWGSWNIPIGLKETNSCMLILMLLYLVWSAFQEGTPSVHQWPKKTVINQFGHCELSSSVSAYRKNLNNLAKFSKDRTLLLESTSHQLSWKAEDGSPTNNPRTENGVFCGWFPLPNHRWVHPYEVLGICVSHPASRFP